MVCEKSESARKWAHKVGREKGGKEKGGARKVEQRKSGATRKVGLEKWG